MERGLSSLFKKQLDEGSQQFLSVPQSIEDRIKELKKIQDEWDERCKKMEENANKAKSIIILDVGGKIFKTTKDTLLSRKDTFFYAMISSGHWLPDHEDGISQTYFIDRNPKVFSYILDYLRNGKIDLSVLDKKELALLKEEADYYLLSDMSPDFNVQESNGQQIDSFDSNCKGNSTTLSNNNKTATASQSGHTCAIGNLGISTGKQRWKIRMNYFARSSHWIMVGVIGKPISSFQSSFSQPASFGLSSKNQKYTGGACNQSLASNDWIAGHVIQVDLDCDSGILKVTNLSSGRFEEWKNLPHNTYYLHVNVYNKNDSVTILDQ